MKTIWKYEVPIGLSVELPGKVVHAAVGLIPHTVRVWCELDASKGRGNEAAIYVVHGTGHDINDDSEHVASVVDDNYGLVWHLYRLSEEAAAVAMGTSSHDDIIKGYDSGR